MSVIGLGERLAGGGLCEVYASGADSVVKLYHQSVPARVAVRELENLAAAFSLGLPVPRPQGVFQAHGRCGLRMQRAAGESLLSMMLADAEAARAGARLLADLQIEIHGHPGRMFPPLAERVGAAIATVAKTDPEQSAIAGRLLDSLPDGEVLCHGDLHPGNVLYGARRAVVLDWFDAARGAREADVARTLVVIDFGAPGRVPGEVREAVRGAYLSRYRSDSPHGLDAAALESWYMVMLAARLAEPIDRRERTAIRGTLPAGAAASGTADDER